MNTTNQITPAAAKLALPLRAAQYYIVDAEGYAILGIKCGKDTAHALVTAANALPGLVNTLEHFTALDGTEIYYTNKSIRVLVDDAKEKLAALKQASGEVI
jgi:hypothetical protein